MFWVEDGDWFYCTQCSIVWKLLKPPQRNLQEKLNFKPYIKRFHGDFKSSQREIETHNKQAKTMKDSLSRVDKLDFVGKPARTHEGLSRPQIRLFLRLVILKAAGSELLFSQPASVPGLTGIPEVAAPDLHHVFRWNVHWYPTGPGAAFMFVPIWEKPQ